MLSKPALGKLLLLQIQPRQSTSLTINTLFCMSHPLTIESVYRAHRTLKQVRFMQFGCKAYPHCGRDVHQVRQAWSRFQQDPLTFLATSPETLGRDILSLCQ
jgi:hypothetical protein